MPAQSGSRPAADPAWEALLKARDLERPAFALGIAEDDEPLDGAELYDADPGLETAATTAIALGQPLLVTGKPGVGKTALARHVALKLGLDRVLRFDTKSTSAAKDLFYTVDTIGWFHAANIEKNDPEAVRPLDFIRYRALGRAMLYSREPAEVAQFMHDPAAHPGRRLSVVLIDEIDKAPRDFPNDLLGELEHFFFEVPELARQLGRGAIRVQADRSLRPVVIITSNSEKALPDAFLRRCVYYDIPFPAPERLASILAAHLRRWLAGQGIELVRDAVRLLLAMQSAHLRKPPSTAEMIGFGRALRARGFTPADRLKDRDDWHEVALASLFKTQDDREAAPAILKAVDWDAPLAPPRG